MVELILNILCGLIPLVYLVIYVAKENKKQRGRRKYLYGLVVALIIALILIIIRLLVVMLLPDKNKLNNQNTTTTTTTTTSETTTSETTTTTTTKATTDESYSRLEAPTGGEVIGKTSKGFEIKKVDGIYYVDNYLVANKTYNLPQSYDPKSLNATVKKAADKMFADAKKEKGFDLYVASGYRSYNTQNSIYNKYVSRDGKEKADTYSARPGYSEHQSGLAFDVCDYKLDDSKCITSGFNNTEQAKWLSENAYKYGFILRYVKNKDNETGYMYESWHFRYVGNDLAKILYNNGNWITVEDYFGITSSYDKKPGE